jgi:hypothetical protein
MLPMVLGHQQIKSSEVQLTIVLGFVITWHNLDEACNPGT